MTACPTLETERLIMRPFRDDDLNSYNKKACILDDQFSKYEIEGEKVNGKLTLGEQYCLSSLPLNVKSYFLKFFI